MHVVIDQPGNDGAAHEVDPPGVGAREPSHLLIAANRYDVVALDRNRLCDRKALVDGDDFAIRENQVRRRLLRAEQARDREQRDH